MLHEVIDFPYCPLVYCCWQFPPTLPSPWLFYNIWYLLGMSFHCVEVCLEVRLRKWHLFFSAMDALGWQGVCWFSVGNGLVTWFFNLLSLSSIQVVFLVSIQHSSGKTQGFVLASSAVKQISVFSLSKTLYRSSNLRKNFLLEKKALKRFISINVSAIWALMVSG